MKFTKFLMFILATLLSSSVFASSLADVVTNPDKLKKRALWQNGLTNASKPKHLINADSLSNKVLTIAFQEANANYRNNAIYFEPKNFVKHPDDLTMYNNLLDLKSLETILFARHKQKNKTSKFFEKIEYFTDSSFTKQMDKIPTVTSIPTRSTYFLKIKQIHLNNTKCQVDFYYQNGTFAIRVLNLETNYFYGTKMNNAKELALTYVLEPIADGYLHVVDVSANITNFEQINKLVDIRTFFSRRMEALKAWFFKACLKVSVIYWHKPVKIIREN